MIANSWHVPCSRFLAACILFSSDPRPVASECAALGLYEPWSDFRGDLPGPDIPKELHGKSGLDLVQAYLGCLDPRVQAKVLP